MSEQYTSFITPSVTLTVPTLNSEMLLNGNCCPIQKVVEEEKKQKTKHEKHMYKGKKHISLLYLAGLLLEYNNFK